MGAGGGGGGGRGWGKGQGPGRQGRPGGWGGQGGELPGRGGGTRQRDDCSRHEQRCPLPHHCTGYRVEANSKPTGAARGRYSVIKCRRRPSATSIWASLTTSGGRNRKVRGPVALITSRCSSSARRASAGASPSTSAATISPSPRTSTTPGSSRSPSTSRSPSSRTRASSVGSSSTSKAALAAAHASG